MSWVKVDPFGEPFSWREQRRILLDVCMCSYRMRVARAAVWLCSVPTPEPESLSELESMDPQKRELLEARFVGKVLD